MMATAKNEVICYNNKGRENDLSVGSFYVVQSYDAEHDAYWLHGVEEKCARVRFEHNP